MRGRGIEETAAVRWKRQQLDGKVTDEGGDARRACMHGQHALHFPACSLGTTSKRIRYKVRGRRITNELTN